jgi:hypothetical protein
VKINLNKILALLGAVAEFAPDVAGASTWLSAHGVGWASYAARGLGVIALLMASLPQIIKRLRAPLAQLGLATPPGAQAPWIPGRDLAAPTPAPITKENPNP